MTCRVQKSGLTAIHLKHFREDGGTQIKKVNEFQTEVFCLGNVGVSSLCMKIQLL